MVDDAVDAVFVALVVLVEMGAHDDSKINRHVPASGKG